MKKAWVYIMANTTSKVLYVGVTSNLKERVEKHKSGFYAGSFSYKYGCKKLVYYKEFNSIVEAIAEEKRIKGGSRKKKIVLIESINAGWEDMGIALLQ